MVNRDKPAHVKGVITQHVFLTMDLNSGPWEHWFLFLSEKSSQALGKNFLCFL